MYSLSIISVFIILGFAFLMRTKLFRSCCKNLWNQWKNCHVIAQILMIVGLVWATCFSADKTNSPPAAPMSFVWPDFSNLALVLDVGDDIDPQSLTTNQYKAGFALVKAETNNVNWVSCSPSNATVYEPWSHYGVAEDVGYSPATNWSFVLGTNNVAGAFFSSSGTLSFQTVKGSPKPHEMPDGTDINFLAPLHAAIGIVPPDGKFWYSTTTSNSMLFTWENVYFGRNTNSVVSFQTELLWTGDFIYRYLFPESLSVTNFVIGAQHNGGGETYVINATNQPPVSLELYWKGFGILDPDIADNDGDGISDGDEVFTTGTDPGSEDSDGDGVNDKDEVDNGTDPNDIDSDDDGIPDGDDPAPNTPNSADADNDGDGYTYIEELFYGTSDNNPNDTTYNMPVETVTFSISGASEPNSLLNVDGFRFPINGKSSLSLKFDVPSTIALGLLNDPTVSVSVSSSVCALLKNKTGGFDGNGEGSASLLLPAVNLEAYDIYIESIGQQVTASVTDDIAGRFEWRQGGVVTTTFEPSVGENNLINGYLELRFYPTNSLNSLYASDDGVIIKDEDIWCPHGLLPWECPDCQNDWCNIHGDWKDECPCINIDEGCGLQYNGDSVAITGGFCSGKTNKIVSISSGLEVKYSNQVVAVGYTFDGSIEFQVRGIGKSSAIQDKEFEIATVLHPDETVSAYFTVADIELTETYGGNNGYIKVKAGDNIACYEPVTLRTMCDLTNGIVKVSVGDELHFTTSGNMTPTTEWEVSPPSSASEYQTFNVAGVRGGIHSINASLCYDDYDYYHGFDSITVEAVCVKQEYEYYFASETANTVYVNLDSDSHDPLGYNVYINGSKVDDGQNPFYVPVENLSIGTYTLKVESDSFSDLYETMTLYMVGLGIEADFDHSGVVGDSGDANLNGEYDDTGLVVPVSTSYVTPIELNIEPLYMDAGSVELSVSTYSGDGEILVYSSPDRTGESLLLSSANSNRRSKTWEISESFHPSDIPSTLYVEGVNGSSNEKDVRLRLRVLEPNYYTVTNCYLYVTVADLDSLTCTDTNTLNSITVVDGQYYDKHLYLIQTNGTTALDMEIELSTDGLYSDDVKWMILQTDWSADVDEWEQQYGTFSDSSSIQNTWRERGDTNRSFMVVAWYDGDRDGEFNVTEPHQTAWLTIVKNSLDIYRLEETKVEDIEEDTMGSITRILNPALGETAGTGKDNNIALELDVGSRIPEGNGDLSVVISLESISNDRNEAGVRVYREADGIKTIILQNVSATVTNCTLTASELDDEFWIEFEKSGIIEVKLAICTNEVEFLSDTVRATGIVSEPRSGKICFVNPDGNSGFPRTDFTDACGSEIGDLVNIAPSNANVVIAGDTYCENNLYVKSDILVTGLGGKFDTVEPYSFDYSNVPLIDCNDAGRIFTIVDDDNIELSSLRIINGKSVRGGAILIDNSENICLNYLQLTNNLAFDYGGAIYMNNATNTLIQNTELKQNTVDHDDNGSVVDTKGMGGAVALFTSDLMITNCNFYKNLAQTYNHSGNKMTTNSAAGGGDIYHNRGRLIIYKSSFFESIAGFEVPTLNHEAGGFTGDGGSILVHGEKENTILELCNSEFEATQSYGNGGAISLSRDSSSAARAYFIEALAVDWPPIASRPEQLGGGCVGIVSNVTFNECLGGWHGGGLSINGRGMEIEIFDSTFSDCKGGNTHLRDGKGGAITVGGGLQDSTYPENYVLVKDTLIENCTATGNGGGLYVTIRGLLWLDGQTTVSGCEVFDEATNLADDEADFRKTEGFGGGVHVTAGGYLFLQVLQEPNALVSVVNNTAKNHGGGISTKSGRIYLYNNVSVLFNKVDTLSAADGYGNGGGLFAGTSYYDDGFVWIEDWELKKGAGAWASYLYGENGLIESESSSVKIEGNIAERWGGGFYAGLFPSLYGNFAPKNRVDASINFQNAIVTNNISYTVSNNSSDYPAQVACERVDNGGVLDFSGLNIAGDQNTDIGVYLWDTTEQPTTNGIIYVNLAEEYVEED